MGFVMENGFVQAKFKCGSSVLPVLGKNKRGISPPSTDR